MTSDATQRGRLERSPQSPSAIRITPVDCPKFDKCSAPICPLDPDWPRRCHLKGERACPFALEATKKGALARFRDHPHEEIVQAAGEMVALPEMLGTNLRIALSRAAASGSRLDKVRRLAAVRWPMRDLNRPETQSRATAPTLQKGATPPSGEHPSTFV
jgi:hypothetical protein